MLAHLQVALFYLAPLVIVVALLLGGRYPGEQQLGRLVRAVRRRRRPRGAAAVPAGRDVVPADRIGGGRLLARRLAGRAPPAVVVP